MIIRSLFSVEMIQQPMVYHLDREQKRGLRPIFLSYRAAAVLCIVGMVGSVLWSNPLRLKDRDQQSVIPGIYQEILLESFDSLPFTERDIRQNESIRAHLIIKEDYPAPLPDSGRYLTVEIESDGPDALQVFFRRQPVLRQHTRWFSIWAHGMKLPGDLLILVEDTRGQVHQLSFGTLNFRGWRRLTAEVPDHVIQYDHVPGINEALKIVQLIYRPGPRKRLKKDQIFFLDNLSASVREKYLLQNP